MGRGRSRRPVRRHRPGDRGAGRLGSRRGPRDVEAAIDAAAAALEDWRSLAAIERGPHPAPSGRPDARAQGRDRCGDDGRAGQAARRGSRRGRLRRGLPRMVLRRGRARLRPGRPRCERREPRARAAPAGRGDRSDHAVELPRRDDDPQARAGDGGRLHEHRQAGERDAADRCARAARDRRRGRTPGRRQPRHLTLRRDGRRDPFRRPRACARSRSPARPRSARN